MVYYKRTYRKKKINYGRRYNRYNKKPVRRIYRRYKSSARYGSQGLPKIVYTKLNFCEVYSLSYTNPTVSNYAFRLNSIYDPDYTNIGKQPYMRDQFAALYGRYCVTGAKVKAYITTNTSAIDSIVTMRANTSTSTIADLQLEIERGAYRTVVTNERPGRLNGYYSIAKVWGTSKNKVLTDDLFSAQVGANPNNAVYLQVAFESMDQSTSASIQVQLQVTYYVKFYDRTDQTSS